MIREWCCFTPIAGPHVEGCAWDPREDRPIDYSAPVQVMEVPELNLPWSAQRCDDDMFPWLVLDRWGVVIGRFDREAQARRAVGVAS